MSKRGRWPRTSRATKRPRPMFVLCCLRLAFVPRISRQRSPRARGAAADRHQQIPMPVARTMPRRRRAGRTAAAARKQSRWPRNHAAGARPMPDSTYKVLFLCTGNSARSVIAEAILNKIGTGKFQAYSAGSQPKGQVNPNTIRLLERLGYDTASLRSKSWGEFAQPGAPVMDFVFTVCDDAAGETCPVWPGQPMTAHWGIPDPAAATGTDAEI